MSRSSLFSFPNVSLKDSLHLATPAVPARATCNNVPGSQHSSIAASPYSLAIKPCAASTAPLLFSPATHDVQPESSELVAHESFSQEVSDVIVSPYKHQFQSTILDVLVHGEILTVDEF